MDGRLRFAYPIVDKRVAGFDFGFQLSIDRKLIEQLATYGSSPLAV